MTMISQIKATIDYLYHSITADIYLFKPNNYDLPLGKDLMCSAFVDKLRR